jgi:hypothetical protein
MITIQGNGIIKTITMIKHLGTTLKRPYVFILCFDYLNVITDEEEDLMFVNELELFSTNTISFPLKAMNVVVVNIVQIERITKISNFVIKPTPNH